MQPWSGDDAYGQTIDFPAEYYLLLPLVSCRDTFLSDAESGGPGGDNDQGGGDDAAALKQREAMIPPLSEEDEALLARFEGTADGQMMAILQRDFRELYPPSERPDPLAVCGGLGSMQTPPRMPPGALGEVGPPEESETLSGLRTRLVESEPRLGRRDNGYATGEAQRRDYRQSNLERLSFGI